MTETLRKPAIFSVDDPRLVIARPEDAQRPHAEFGAGAPADLPRRARSVDEIRDLAGAAARGAG